MINPLPPILKTDLNESILLTNPCIWDLLRGKSIFITGGTGFIGKWLIETLIFANDLFFLNLKIFILSRNPDLFLQSMPHLKLVKISIYSGLKNRFKSTS